MKCRVYCTAPLAGSHTMSSRLEHCIVVSCSLVMVSLNCDYLTAKDRQNSALTCPLAPISRAGELGYFGGTLVPGSTPLSQLPAIHHTAILWNTSGNYILRRSTLMAHSWVILA